MKDKTQLQPGLYQANIVSQQMGETKTGKPQFILTVSVTARVISDSQVSPIESVDRTIYMVITDNTVPYVVRDLRSIGFRSDSWAMLDPDIPGYHNFNSVTLTVNCEHSVWKDKKNEKWSIYSERETKKLPPDGIRKLDAMFGRALKEPPQTATQAPVAAPEVAEVAAVAAVAPSGDVPF